MPRIWILIDAGLARSVGYAVPFWLVFALLVSTTLATAARFAETNPPESRQRVSYLEAFTNLEGVIRDRRLRPLYLVNFLFYLAIFGFFRSYPMYLVDEFRPTMLRRGLPAMNRRRVVREDPRDALRIVWGVLSRWRAWIIGHMTLTRVRFRRSRVGKCSGRLVVESISGVASDRPRRGGPALRPGGLSGGRRPGGAVKQHLIGGGRNGA